MNYNFENIAGYENEKQELMRLCEVFNNSSYYLKKGAQLPKGIIFYGYSGNGKTLFAKVLADSCNLNVKKIDLTNIKKEGDICKLIKLAFKSTKNKKNPTMIFLDEIDKILPNPAEKYVTDQSKSILAQLLTLIDGMDATNAIFVATCNDYDSLPEPLVRPGRIDKKIYIPHPNYTSRLAVLNYYYSKTTCQFEMPVEEIANFCTNFSCAGLQTLVNECIMRSDKNNFVSKEIIKQVCYEILQENIPKQDTTISDQISAYSITGKFIVAKALNLKDFVLKFGDNSLGNPFLQSAIQGYDADEYDDYDPYDDEYDEDSFDNEPESKEFTNTQPNFYSHFCKQDFINFISIILGGYVSQEIIFNKTYDIFNADYETINIFLIQMLKNGMFGLELAYSDRLSSDMPYSKEYDNKVHNLFTSTILSCYETAKNILTKNIELIKALGNEMITKNILRDSDCDIIIKNFGGIKL